MIKRHSLPRGLGKIESVIINQEELLLFGGRDKIGYTSEVHK